MTHQTTFQTEISEILLQHPELSKFIQKFNYQALCSSFSQLTFSPERKAASTVKDFAQRAIQFKSSLKSAIEAAKSRGAVVANDGEFLPLVNEESETFNEKLYELFMEYVRAESRCANWMITGPARFPVERNRKRMDISMARYQRISEISEKALKGALRRILPEGDGITISSASNTAVEQLESKIKAAQDEHAQMILINKIVRKYYPKGNPEISDEQKARCLDELAQNLNQSVKEVEIYVKPNRMYGTVVPFQSFTLTNSNARIKNMQQRLQEQKKLEEQRESNTLNGELDNGIKFYLTDDNRLAIDFGFKPSADIRQLLNKQAHFNFSRTRGNLWIRKHTRNAEYDFKNLVLPALQALEAQA